LILAQTPPKNSGENHNEAEFCLETLLFGEKIDSIGLRDGEYLLSITKWKVLNVEHFQNKLKQLTIEDKEQNKQSRLNLPYNFLLKDKENKLKKFLRISV